MTLSLKSISQRQDTHGLPLPTVGPRESSDRTSPWSLGMPQRLEGHGTKVPERRCNRHELIRRAIWWALSSDGLECGTTPPVAMTPLGAI